MLYYIHNLATKAAHNMLTTKQLARNIFLTQCSTTNTLFVHSAKVKTKNVSKQTAYVVQQQFVKQQFAQLASVYNLNAHTRKAASKLANMFKAVV